ncbi:lysine 6-aminotransferase, partial [Stenotrophomonas maltophilia]
GDPGRSVPPSFYAVARELTRAHGSLLLLDSIQACAKVFEDAARNQWFIEAVFLEPVMGEGDPGRSVPP